MPQISIHTELSHRFIGDWTIIGQARAETRLPCYQLTTVKIRLKAEGNPILYKIVYESLKKCNDTTEKTETKEFEFHLREGTLRCPRGEHCISFWHNPTCDMIFCLEKKGNKSTKAWTAKRLSSKEDSYPNNVRKRLTRKWEISLTTGKESASGYVQIKEFNAEIGHEHLELFGLFQAPRRDSKNTEWRFYDILSYDDKMKSFNSVFGVRSLNIWKREDSDEDRIFATFNNRSSIPITHLRNPDLSPEQPNACLGNNLPWEESFGMQDINKILTGSGKETEVLEELKSRLKNYSVDDDPDIGIWVGDPP